MFLLITALEDILANDRTLIDHHRESERLEDKVRRIQNGDSDLRNQVIIDCLPYIKGILHRMLPIPYIEQADEYSIALTAFNDALDHYRCESNVPFLRFAGLVINRRIIDWLRQQRHNRGILTFSQCEDEQGESFTENLRGSSGSQVWENMEIEEELVHLRLRLQEYNLSLAGLVQNFPRHRDSRLILLRLARLILATPDLRQRFDREKRLPAADLARLSLTPLKTIERNRASIIFLVLLLMGDLEVIKSYLAQYGKEANV